MDSTVHGSHTHRLLPVDESEPVLWTVRLGHVAAVDKRYGIVPLLCSDREEWGRSGPLFSDGPGRNLSYTHLKLHFIFGF